MSADLRERTLLALIDFLLGDSVDDIAARYRLSRDGAEDGLRRVLLAYGFAADRPPEPRRC